MNHSGRQNSKNPPWQRDESESLSFGTWLRRQRELREISLREIADYSKVSLRYLEALERDCFDDLPAPVFTKGFLRSYAQYVGLDPDEVVNTYLTARKEEEPAEAPESTPEPSAPPGRPSLPVLLATGGALALLVLVAILVFRSDGSREGATEAPPIAPPTLPLVPAGEGAAAPETALPSPPSGVDRAAAPLVVTIDFTGDCWIEARVDGEPRISELRVQGESLTLEAQEIVALTLGNAAATEIEVNGRPWPLQEGRGGSVRTIEITLDAAGAAGE